MGTRVDFYLGRDPETMEWLGSYPFDGYPRGAKDKKSGIFQATTEEQFRAEVEAFLAANEGESTKPSEGWPWPWEDSGTTDYSYAFDGGVVYGTCFGNGWWPVKDGQPEGDGEPVSFPDMSARKNVKLGAGSGIILIWD